MVLTVYIQPNKNKSFSTVLIRLLYNFNLKKVCANVASGTGTNRDKGEKNNGEETIKL